MNQTPNYQLSQWEADDRVQRTDFNADNAKIDAAIKAVDRRVDGLSAGKADASEVPRLEGLIAARADIVIGTYTGNGQPLRFINLGFNPKALLVVNYHGMMYDGDKVRGGLVFPGYPIEMNGICLELVDGGFNVAYGSTRKYTNAGGDGYYYLALR